MTIKECIDMVDNIKPNQYTVKDKVSWLSFIDQIIINDVLKTHEGYDGHYDDFTGYSDEKLAVRLVVPSPYDRLYPAYLQMKIDGENGETARYNNSASLFNSYMMEYRKYYNKTHMPLDLTAKKKPMEIKKQEAGISQAEMENLKKELYYLLSEDFAQMTSQDKIYDIVMSFVHNNTELLTSLAKYDDAEIKKSIEVLQKEIANMEVDGGVTEETDPTVPEWAKQPNKPTYTADEVGALPKDTTIPTKVSQLENDKGYLTTHQDISAKADKPVVTTSTVPQYLFEFYTENNTEVRLSVVEAIVFSFSNGEYSDIYTSGLSFDSGETPTSIVYTSSGILNWVGTDCTTVDGLSIFQPSANTHYDIVFYFNGTQFIGLVNGFVPCMVG